MVSEVFSIELVRDTFSSGGGSPLPASSLLPPAYFGGPENQLVQVLADQVLQPEVRYSPVIVYGPTGVGKSLLLRGLAAKRQQQQSSRHPAFTTGADFARSYNHALQSDSLSHFRKQWTRSELLVIDDLEELVGKEGAQRELRLLLDRPPSGQRLVLLSCPLPPSELDEFLPDLRSRLSAGLWIPLNPPSAHCRHLILVQLCGELGIPASSELEKKFFHATRDSGPLLTVPALRQVLMRCVWSLHRKPRASRLGAPHVPAEESPEDQQVLVVAPSLEVICAAVAEEYQLRPAELLGPSRRQSVVHARSIAIHMSRTLGQASLTRIGSYFGGRDHTTILHAFRKIEQLRQSDSSLRFTMERLEQRLRCSATSVENV